MQIELKNNFALDDHDHSAYIEFSPFGNASFVSRALQRDNATVAEIQLLYQALSSAEPSV